ncbi:unnamed protein product [Acanthoscelides obtectus]|uniref:MADF domain-containing protein n=1 Tax=Acanthoscelides obtectus TaxID=200917 RepID=A0A9P0LT18_ACAOB|nr:unnamed protein product [Acanthoscelides obtectus]CAK1651314.1 hypothetical protein AOBTE_LOCUS17176 [Acanthoscelides obtectus]
MNTIDTESFIREVRARSVIWDSTLSGYSYKNEKRKAWRDLCRIFLEGFHDRTEAERCKLEIELQKKWKNLRDCYTRELNKQNNVGHTQLRKKYVFFDMLSFLYPVCINRLYLTSEDAERARVTSPLKLQEETQNKPKKVKPAQDSDKFFLLSLLTDLKNVPEHYKMDCKLELMNILKKYNAEYDCTSQTEYPDSTYQAQYSSQCVSSTGLSQTDIINDIFGK